jgi:ABC-2 type transport system ATP-binding protein
MAIIVAQALERSFGATRALAGLSFSVEQGELFGLVGADGAGKTTTIRALAGLIGLDGGRADIAGHDVAAGGSAARESLGLMPQQASLYPDLSIAENLRFFGRLFCLPKRVFHERRERLLGITRLGPFADRRADALSGGMYKKLALACALLHRPRVLLLDEPTVGVDPVSRRELWALLHELVQEGMTVLLSTPYMDEAERCHRVALVHEGRLLLEGEPSALLADFTAQPGVAASPTFESLFLATLEAAARERPADA